MHSALLLIALAFSCAPTLAATRAEIMSVAEDLVCLCGNCPRESLATCLCSDFAVPERETIGQALDQGRTREQIIEDYVSRFGPAGLAVPPREGFNLLAWVAPFVALLFGIVLVRTLLVNWKGRERENPQSNSAPIDRSQYQDRLRSELERYDDE